MYTPPGSPRSWIVLFGRGTAVVVEIKNAIEQATENIVVLDSIFVREVQVGIGAVLGVE
jgi:hypothetical protein